MTSSIRGMTKLKKKLISTLSLCPQLYEEAILCLRYRKELANGISSVSPESGVMFCRSPETCSQDEGSSWRQEAACRLYPSVPNHSRVM